MGFFSLWLYSPILGLGRIHKTFRFISVTRSRTLGRIHWTGDQLVARTLLTAPGWLTWWWSWWNKWLWQGKPKYSEKTCPDATLSTTNPTCQARARTRGAAVGSQRLTASAMARPEMNGNRKQYYGIHICSWERVAIKGKVVPVLN
jgi:hypothetical protein